MEAEIDELFTNVTSLEEDDEYIRPFVDYLQEYLELTAVLIGILCNALIIYIVIKNKPMRLRTNVILVNWGIADLLFGVCTLYQVSTYFSKKDHSNIQRFVTCFMSQFEMVNFLNAATFMVILITPKIMKNKNIRNVLILSIVYAIALVMFIADLILCSLRSPSLITVFTFLIVSIYLLITVIVKDINRCRKKSATPTSQKTLTRLNLAKIFVYNWVVTATVERIISYFGDWYIIYHSRIIYFTLYLTSLYILIYLYRTDKHFKICTLSLLKCNSSSYDVDATIRFEEDCKDEIEDDDDYKVNVNINSNNTV